MARKEISNNLDRNNRNAHNNNYIELYGDLQNIVGKITDEAFDKIVEGSKIDWEQMVDTVGNLPTNAKEGETRGVKADNKFYRYDGKKWVAIGEINLNPIQEVDDRLTTQLAETVKDGVTLSGFDNINEAIDYAVSHNLPNIYLDTESIGVHNVDFKGLNVLGSNTTVTGSPKNVKSFKGVNIKGVDQDVKQYGTFENLSGTVTSKVVHKISNDEINVYSKKPFSGEYLEFQFKSGIYTENNSAGSPAELLRLVGVKNITHAYSQLTTPKNKSDGWEDYPTHASIPSVRQKSFLFNRHSSAGGWIEFDVYVNQYGDFAIGLYASNASAENVIVKFDGNEIASFSARSINGPYLMIKKIKSNLREGIHTVRFEKTSSNALIICANMYLLHDTPINANIDRVAFFDDGNDYISNHGALDYAMLDDEGTYWGSFHGGETRSSLKLILDGVNYSASGHNGKFITCTKMEISQTTQIGDLFRSRTSQQIGRDGFFDFRFALNGDANLRTLYTTMTTASNSFNYVMYPRLQNVSNDGEYNFGRTNKIVQVNNDTDQAITTLFTRYENENNSQGGVFIRTTQGAYNKVYYGPVVAGMRNVKDIHGENTRVFE